MLHGEGPVHLDLDTVKRALCTSTSATCVRSAANPAGEDAPDLDKVVFDRSRYAALSRGYLDEARSFLTLCGGRAAARFGEGHHLRTRHPLPGGPPSRRHLLQGQPAGPQPSSPAGCSSDCSNAWRPPACNVFPSFSRAHPGGSHPYAILRIYARPCGFFLPCRFILFAEEVIMKGSCME